MFRFFENLVDPYGPYEQKDVPPTGLWPFLADYARPFHRIFVATGLMAVVVAVIEIWLIAYLGRLLDMLEATERQAFWSERGLEMLLVAAFVLFLRPALQALDVLLLNNAILPNFGTLIRYRAHRHVLRQSVEWFEARRRVRLLPQLPSLSPPFDDPGVIGSLFIPDGSRRANPGDDVLTLSSGSHMRKPMRSLRGSGLRARASALLLVLVMVALITLLTVAFLSFVRVETRSSDAFAKGVEVGVLADLPTDLVVGQIRRATESNGSQSTWASQPGAIRVYGSDGDPGTGRAPLRALFKLYSSREMVDIPGAGEAFDPDDELPPADWPDRPGEFIDLNEPVSVDPDRDGVGRWRYPIVDPAALAAGIEGFDLGAAPGASAEQPVPMPVEWIYVLEDGTLTSPTSASGGVLTFPSSGEGAPTAQNPIVSRVAFWADDESCKVNINTASEGVFWDMPRSNANRDFNYYAERQPVRGEFQRYPGHPSTTRLSPVLKGWLGEGPATYYDLSPFINHGGSQGGTVAVELNAEPVTPDSDRLYATVDEYIFGATSLSADGTRTPNHPAIDREVLDATKFFLTAHSRAPETNLFNKPPGESCGRCRPTPTTVTPPTASSSSAVPAPGPPEDDDQEYHFQRATVA